MSAYFDTNGVTMDKLIGLDQLRTAIKSLKYMVTKNEVKHNPTETLELINTLEEIEIKTTVLSNRRIHIVVAEPVEYVYPD